MNWNKIFALSLRHILFDKMIFFLDQVLVII